MSDTIDHGIMTLQRSGRQRAPGPQAADVANAGPAALGSGRRPGPGPGPPGPRGPPGTRMPVWPLGLEPSDGLAGGPSLGPDSARVTGCGHRLQCIVPVSVSARSRVRRTRRPTVALASDGLGGP
jgi:hypothetical protein